MPIPATKRAAVLLIEADSNSVISPSQRPLSASRVGLWPHLGHRMP
jgi:hypothetical protein